MIFRRALVAAAACAFSLLQATDLLGQDDVSELASECSAGESTTLGSPCLEAALAVRSVQGLVGLTGSVGVELSGSSSTLGKRFGGAPRLGLATGVIVVDGNLPSALAPTTGVASSEGVRLIGFQATGSAGLFNGFSPAPTMGGILAVDALATFSYVGAPDRLGFEDGAVGLGVGLRVGVFRESFTLPGVTLSMTRRWLGTIELSGSGGSRADVGVTATSFRLTVGKELASFGVLAGVGWDRYRGEAELEVRSSGSTGPLGVAGSSAFGADRHIVFGGAGYTFLIAQIAVEGGWASGQDNPDGRSRSGFDPGDGSLFARLSFRLTL